MPVGGSDDPLVSLNNIYNPNDFCVQHRKRIQQAQERLIQKITASSPSTGHASLILSQLSDLLPMTPSSCNSLASNGSASGSSSMPSRRRSLDSKPCSSSSESESSPLPYAKPPKTHEAADPGSASNAQSHHDKRVETPDTTTSELSTPHSRNRSHSEN